MKKHSLTFLICAILLSLLVAGCKSTPESIIDVDPFTFIGDHDLYFHFPVKGNESIAEQFMARYFADISKQAKKQILSRTASLYGGFGPGSGEIELVVFGSFPKSALTSSLTKKNGWITVQKNVIYRHSATGIELHLGTPGLLLVAFDTDAMNTRALSGTRDDRVLSDDTSERLKKNKNDSDIQFFLPGALKILPAQLNTALATLPMANEASAFGMLEKMPENGDYMLSLDVDLHNEMAAIFIPLLVRTISNYVQVDVTVGEAGHILVGGIRLKESAIQNILK